MQEYIMPEFFSSAFNCPHCNAFAHQQWSNRVLMIVDEKNPILIDGLSSSNCIKCGKMSYWQDEKMIYPTMLEAPQASKEMPDMIKKDYNEARLVFSNSSRSAAALLRLVIQKLCIELGEKGKNINDDIASLVKKGLPDKIQQGLDVVRVIGNNAVHPGVIDVDDNPEMVLGLFKIVNLIVETMITTPKEINEMYQNLPESAQKQINNRDSKN